MDVPRERRYFLVQVIGQGTQASRTGRDPGIGRAAQRCQAAWAGPVSTPGRGGSARSTAGAAGIRAEVEVVNARVRKAADGGQEPGNAPQAARRAVIRRPGQE